MSVDRGVKVVSRARNITASCSADGSEEGSPEDATVCWICLDSSRSSDAPLRQACRCPRLTHPACMARWQLQSAGTQRETNCEFCNETLPDWKAVLTPPGGVVAPSVMNVHFDGKTYSFEVQPGPEGYGRFTTAIREAFTLPADSDLNITFTCDEPISGALLTLAGPGAFDAAVHCASVAATKRLLAAQRASIDALQRQPGATPPPPLTSCRQDIVTRHYPLARPPFRDSVFLPQLVVGGTSGEQYLAGHMAGQHVAEQLDVGGSTPGSSVPVSVTSAAGRLMLFTRRVRTAINDLLFDR